MINPVFRRELRTNLRTWRSFAVISIYVLILSIFAGLTLLSVYGNSYSFGFNPRDAIRIYAILAGFQIGIITLIIPSLTSGTISGERERQTLDLLLVTKMSTVTIIIGKLLSSVSMVILLMLASLPVFGIVLYYGGVNILQMMGMFGFSLVVAIMVGSLSIFYSAVFKKTVASLVLTFITLGFIGLGLFVIMSLVHSVMWSFFGTGIPVWLWYATFAINPYFSFISLMDMQLGSNYINGMLYSLVDYALGQEAFFPVWIVNLIFNILFSLLILWLSSVIINPVKGKRKKRKQSLKVK